MSRGPWKKGRKDPAEIAAKHAATERNQRKTRREARAAMLTEAYRKAGWRIGRLR